MRALIHFNVGAKIEPTLTHLGQPACHHTVRAPRHDRSRRHISPLKKEARLVDERVGAAHGHGGDEGVEAERRQPQLLRERPGHRTEHSMVHSMEHSMERSIDRSMEREMERSMGCSMERSMECSMEAER